MPEPTPPPPLPDPVRVTTTATGSFYYPCDAEVTIVETQKGGLNNSIQQITLPNPSSGTWKLTTKVLANPSKTITLNYNATADDISIELTSYVGDGNVAVTGSGTVLDPFTIEFIGGLAGQDIAPITADAADLGGSPFSSVEKLVNGTKNERQTVYMQAGNMESLVLKFGDNLNPKYTIPIEYNASLNTRQSAIEALSNIGAGNVSVTGGTTDRNIAYIGDFTIDFVGSFAAQNVSEFVPLRSDKTSSKAYTVVTDWQGGTGVNDKQLIKTSAGSGTFKLTVYKPGGMTESAETAALAYNSTAAQVKAGILEVAPFLTDADIIVTSANDPDTPALTAWKVEFAGQYAGIEAEQMLIDGTNLQGGRIVIEQVSIGSASAEQQLVTITKANSGYYRLTLTYNETTATTEKIAYNAKAPQIALTLYKMPFLSSSLVRVVERMAGVTNPDVTYKYLIIFNASLGDVPDIKPEYLGTLQCIPITMAYVPPGPYMYSPSRADLVEDIGCQSGPLFTRPGPGDPESVVTSVTCPLPEAANVARSIVYQRDLISPSQKTGLPARNMTIKDVALLKGKNPQLYTPYLRNAATNTLTETVYAREIEPGMSIVLIAKPLVTPGNVNTIVTHLGNSKEILPSRYVYKPLT